MRARKEIEITRHDRRAREEPDAARRAREGQLLGDGLGGTRFSARAASPARSSDREITTSGACSGSCSRRLSRRGRSASRSAIRSARAPSEANLARARLERDQAAERLRSAKRAPCARCGRRRCVSSRTPADRDDARSARELAEQRLDAERKRFEVGMSTSFLVIQAQRDLAVAANGELQAQLDYQLAAIAFETAQQTSTRILPQ